MIAVTTLGEPLYDISKAKRSTFREPLLRHRNGLALNSFINQVDQNSQEDQNREDGGSVSGDEPGSDPLTGKSGFGRMGSYCCHSPKEKEIYSYTYTRVRWQLSAESLKFCLVFFFFVRLRGPRDGGR